MGIDRRDIILDNHRDKIVLWSEAGCNICQGSRSAVP